MITMTSIRPMTDDERNRAKERAIANMHDPFGNFPKKSLEARIEAIEEFMEVLLDKPEYQHALEVKRMKANVKRSIHEHYKVKPNYTD